MAFPISVIQLDIDPAHPEDNRANALALAGNAIARGAKCVVLPEAAVTDFYRGTEALAEPIPGPLTAAFQAIAAGSIVALPLLERTTAGMVHSACALIDSSGILGVARRTHLYYDPSGFDLFKESDHIQSGNELCVIDAGEIRIGIALGFDAEFPETFRTLALSGADVIVVALNCVEPDLAFLGAMAKRNLAPVAVANRIGFKRVYPSAPEFSANALPFVQNKRGEYMLRCKGNSAIFGPDGTIQAQPQSALADSAAETPIPERLKIPKGHLQEEEILTASFAIDELRIQKLTHPYLTARRPGLYK